MDTKELLAATNAELDKNTATLAADGFNDPSLPNSGRTDQLDPQVQMRFQRVRSPLMNKLYNLPVKLNTSGVITSAYIIGALSDEDLGLQETDPTKEVSWTKKTSKLGIGKAGAKHEWTADELQRKINLAQMNGLVLSDTNESDNPLNESVRVITSNITNYISKRLWNGTLSADGAFGIVGLLTQFTKFNKVQPAAGAVNARYNNVTYPNTALGYKNFFTDLVARFNILQDMGVDEMIVKFAYGNMQKMIEAYYKNYLEITIIRQDYSSRGIDLTSRETTPDVEQPWLKFMEVDGMGANQIMAYPSIVDGQTTYERHAFGSIQSGAKELEIYTRTDRPKVALEAGFGGELIGLSSDLRNGIVQTEMITYPSFAFKAVGLGCFYSVAQFITGPAVIDPSNPKMRDAEVGNTDFTQV